MALVVRRLCSGSQRLSKRLLLCGHQDIYAIFASTFAGETTDCQDATPEFNEIHIQMLPKSLHKQVFGQDSTPRVVTSDQISVIREHLAAHNLWDKTTFVSKDVNFKLPKLQGENLGEHFWKLAESQTESYVAGAEQLVGIQDVPAFPKEWALKAGWCKYDSQTGRPQSVDFPEEAVLVFDVEVLMTQDNGHWPTLAAALSPTAW